MQNSPPLFLLVLATLGFVGAFVTFTRVRMQSSRISPSLSISMALPAMVMLGLFYSLAIHMYQSLGGWPEVIGMRGFSTPLITHVGIASQFFSVMLVTGVIAWPLACMLSVVNPRWRGGLVYFGIFALSCFVCFAAMLLAPAEFLIWWWD